MEYRYCSYYYHSFTKLFKKLKKKSLNSSSWPILCYILYYTNSAVKQKQTNTIVHKFASGVLDSILISKLY